MTTRPMTRRFLFVFLCAVLAASGCSYLRFAPPPEVTILATPPAVGFRQTAPIVYWQEVWQTPRLLRLSFMRIDLKNPRIEVFTMLGDDPDGSGPAEAALTLPDTLALRYHAIAAVNANAFRGLPDSTGKTDSVWFVGKPVDIAGLGVCNGVVRSAPEKNRNEFWIDKKRKAHIGVSTPKDTPVQGVADWIDGLLFKGQMVAKPAKDLNPRTLVGLDKSGRWLLIAVIDGRRAGYSDGVTTPEEAKIMLDHGCYDAINLDGGGSSAMFGMVGGQLKLLNRPSGNDLRPIPIMLGVRVRR
jgi:hypothetical protein